MNDPGDIRKNASGAVDTTPYPVLKEVEDASRQKLKLFMRAVIGMAKAMHIQVLTRIDLRDNDTGVVWRTSYGGRLEK